MAGARTEPQLMPKLPAVDEGIPDLASLPGFDLAYATKLIFIVFLRWLFTKSFEGLAWNLDEKKTEIVIGDKNQSYSQGVNKKPRIVIDRLGVRWDNVSFDKTIGGGSLGTVVLRGGIPIDEIAGPNAVVPGQRTMADVMSGTSNIICLAEDGLLAERLASFVFLNIRLFRSKLRQMGFYSVDSAGIGRESPDFATSNYRMVAVPVNVRFSLFVSVIMTQLGGALGDCGLLEKVKLSSAFTPKRDRTPQAANAAAPSAGWATDVSRSDSSCFSFCSGFQEG